MNAATFLKPFELASIEETSKNDRFYYARVAS
jgi:hypothetical protein